MRESKDSLYMRSKERVEEFIKVNNLPSIIIQSYAPIDWKVDACGYYRQNKIFICLKHCANECTDAQFRNWCWPGSSIDRTVYGVVCHELAHHIDHCEGKIKNKYSSEYSDLVRSKSKEKALTGYCPNTSEWFAEIGRLFISNHALLKLIRPVTHKILIERWKPISNDDWIKELGDGVPERIIKSNMNKIPLEKLKK